MNSTTIILSASMLISHYRIVFHFRKYAANKIRDFEIKSSVILKYLYKKYARVVTISTLHFAMYKYSRIKKFL